MFNIRPSIMKQEEQEQEEEPMPQPMPAMGGMPFPGA